MYDLYLFDFDYTLVNSEKGIIDCFRKTIDQLGYCQPSDEQIKNTIGMSLNDTVPLFTGNSDKKHIELFTETFLKYAETFMTPGTEFFPAALPVLTAIKNEKKKVAIISSKRSSRIAEKFSLENATSLVDIIIGCLEVTHPKPSPEGINLVLAQLGISRERALYIGDTIIDAKAAAAAGVSFAAVTTGTTSAETFTNYPHCKIMASLTELLPIS